MCANELHTQFREQRGMTMNNQKSVAGCKAVSDAGRALLCDRGNAPLLSRLRHRSFTGRCVLLLAFLASMTVFGLAAPAHSSHRLAVTPPMGWNDWAHYQCGFTAQTVLDNANALVRTGLAAAGYKTVIIDDCWMQKGRDKPSGRSTTLSRRRETDR